MSSLTLSELRREAGSLSSSFLAALEEGCTNRLALAKLLLCPEAGVS